MRKNRAFGFAVVVVALGALPSACSTSQSAVGSGGACLTATDCQPGLVCIPQPNGAQSVCSNDLSGVQKTESTDSGADGAVEATVLNGDSGTTTTTTDGSTFTPDDSGGSAEDTYRPPVDSGVTDSGTSG